MIIKCVIMGVSGSGKSTVGKAIANHFKASFIDGDDLHPRANIIKMKSGIPLDDEDRKPWLERINDVFFSFENRHQSGVVVCSALKKKYRDMLREGNEGLIFVHLYGSKDLIRERMSRRQGHFMKEEMLNSQFAALEFPDSEADVINVDISGSPEEIVKKAVSQIEKKVAHE
ncbi:gluconokinase [Succinivibrio dextrinosolvens]|uniref:gluconokinase n=1 Tax=Succinivibrio dextrinosolvens TaxID=83771 RepID=UPI0008E877FB|nr:gluconokinase [Succinivibrio dextrinosolvens]SFS70440.1 gluconokinase [Succinivibrio dextrinosolvens]